MEWTVAIGVDTHKDVHVAVALDTLGGHATAARSRPRLRGTGACSLGAGARGARLRGRGPGQLRCWACSLPRGAGVRVFECERPRRRERWRGKSD